MASEKWELLEIQASQVFTPAAPIDAEQLFAGRLEQLVQVEDVVNQKGQHAVIFGERGVGKTSIANIIVARFRSPSVFTLRKNCDSSDDYRSLWKKIFDDIDLIANVNNIGFAHTGKVRNINANDLLPGDISPDNVRKAITKLSTIFVPIIIIDEFDRISSSKVRAAMADTIKTLSDNAVGATIILVGVADSVGELIKEHQSIERAMVQIRMPRMSDEELGIIMSNGLKVLGIGIKDDAKKYITLLSQGLPHYTHLLSLHSVRNAAKSQTDTITISHVEIAISTALQQAQQTTLDAYHKAIMSPRKDNLFSQVLLACALAHTDDLGYFAAADVRTPLSKIMGKAYEIPSFSRHLNDFCDSSRGPIFHKIGETRRYRFRFINPLMQPFVVMQGFANGLVDKNTLESLRTK